MTAIRSWTIQCDGCGDNLGRGDLSEQTAYEARSFAKSWGAHVNLPGGRDLCQVCWEDGIR